MDEHDSQPDDEDERTLLSSTPKDGTAIGNGRLRDKLGWEEADYEEIKRELVEAELLHVGKGRGGSIFRPPSLASSMMPPVVTSTAGRAKVTSAATLSATPSVVIQRRTEPPTGRAVAEPSPPAFNGVVAASPGAGPAVRPSPTAAPGDFYFPPPLLEAYRQNKLAVLFGSGLSPTKKAGGPFPTWEELPERLLDQALQHGVMTPRKVDAHREVFASGHDSLEAMLDALEGIKSALIGMRKYQAALEAIFCPANAKSVEIHGVLVDLDVKVLVTTNYDQLLEYAEGPPRRDVYTWPESDSALSRIKTGHKVLFKIHGTADKEKTVVMTRREYDTVARDKAYQEIMRHLLQNYTFLLVGYGVNDPCDLDMAFGRNVVAFGSAANAHYALMKEASGTDVNRWRRDLNVQVLPYDDHAKLPDILRALRAHKP